jgi:hypothetical protein
MAKNITRENNCFYKTLVLTFCVLYVAFDVTWGFTFVQVHVLEKVAKLPIIKMMGRNK